ncbi:MAG TPA: hypothetical protein VF650_00350 [Allosphingosinicella sp.]|jgi:hypothetical protein
MASGEDLLVGLIAGALLPLIAWRVLRGLREGRLPLYRTYVDRDEAGSKFGLLLALHALSFVLVAAIAADLLFQLGLKEAL